MHSLPNPMSKSIFNPYQVLNACPFRKIAFAGAGDVVRNRMIPGLGSDQLRHLEVAICSLESATPIKDYPHKYFQVGRDNLLPLDELAESGFLSDDTLWIVATPPQTHVLLALQLAGRCGRVAVEKPIAANAKQARILLPLAYDGSRVFPMDHKLFAAEGLRFLNSCRKDPKILRRISRIEGAFFETSGFAPGRAQEDGIADVQWHLAMFLIAAFKNLAEPVEMALDSVEVSRHLPDPAHVSADATVPTASRLTGTVVAGSTVARFDLLQAKATATREKYLKFFDSTGEVIAEVDLSESGWQAHARMISALTLPAADMYHTLADSIALAGLFDGLSAGAREDDPYPFGEVPAFAENTLGLYQRA